MEKILTVNSRLSCSTFRDSFTDKGHLPYSKQHSGEDPNEAIFILKCEMDLSKSGSDHYSNHVNVNRGKLHFSGCCNSKWIRLDVQRILSLGLIAFAAASS